MIKNKLGKPVSQRQLRVGEMIKQALGMIFLRDEAKLPNLDTREITVTEVRMSQDLKIAKAFVLPLGGQDAEEKIKTLNDQLEKLQGSKKKEIEDLKEFQNEGKPMENNPESEGFFSKVKDIWEDLKD